MAMTFEEYEEEHLHDLNHEARRLVRMGWNARGSHGNCQGILDSSASEVSITTEMIEAGAQRLVAWEENSEWPDSWSPMAVAAARNDAERVLRSALNVRTDHIAEARNMVKGDVSTAGSVILLEGKTYKRAIVVAFESDDDLRAAIAAGQCRFTVFGGEV